VVSDVIFEKDNKYIRVISCQVNHGDIIFVGLKKKPWLRNFVDAMKIMFAAFVNFNMYYLIFMFFFSASVCRALYIRDPCQQHAF
jgi:hypothetical protein